MNGLHDQTRACLLWSTRPNEPTSMVQIAKRAQFNESCMPSASLEHYTSGSPGMRATRCTLVQMIEQMHPGETLAFEPGYYRTDNPIRVYKAIEIIRHPDYGANVGPPNTAADAVVPFAGAPQTSYAFGNAHRGPVEFGPRAAGAVVIEAPLFAFGGGVAHAGWKGGGPGGGGGGGDSGGAGGGLGRVAGVTLSCSHVSFSGHSQVVFEAGGCTCCEFR
jgi:hypothetical protein